MIKYSLRRLGGQRRTCVTEEIAQSLHKLGGIREPELHTDSCSKHVEGGLGKKILDRVHETRYADWHNIQRAKSGRYLHLHLRGPCPHSELLSRRQGSRREQHNYCTDTCHCLQDNTSVILEVAQTTNSSLVESIQLSLHLHLHQVDHCNSLVTVPIR